MKAACVLVFLGMVALGWTLPAAAQGEQHLGIGVHYHRTLGDIRDAEDFDENSLGFLMSYRFRGSGSLLAVEFGLEWLPDYGGSSQSLWQPQAYLILGNLVYGAVGIGIGSFGGRWQDNPFYALRAGFNIPLGNLLLDVNANYRFQSAKVFEDVDQKDLDALTFGASLRFGDVGGYDGLGGAVKPTSTRSR